MKQIQPKTKKELFTSSFSFRVMRNSILHQEAFALVQKQVKKKKSKSKVRKDAFFVKPKRSQRLPAKWCSLRR
jgi:hypothetical protein